MKFSIIYVDPPWTFDAWSDKGKDRSAENHYDVMSVNDICKLRVSDITSKDAALFLWVNGPRLFDADKVINAWGFTYKTIAFNWLKITSTGNLNIGCGYYTRANSELCLLATRGKPLTRLSKSIRQGFLSRRREHSRKPDEVRDWIVELFGDLPRIELFARDKYPGWYVWGDEVDSDIELKWD